MNLTTRAPQTHAPGLDHYKIAASLAAVSSQESDLMFELFGKLIQHHISHGACACPGNASHSILDEIQWMIALELGAH